MSHEVAAWAVIVSISDDGYDSTPDLKVKLVRNEIVKSVTILYFYSPIIEFLWQVLLFFYGNVPSRSLN